MEFEKIQNNSFEVIFSTVLCGCKCKGEDEPTKGGVEVMSESTKQVGSCIT